MWTNQLYYVSCAVSTQYLFSQQEYIYRFGNDSRSPTEIMAFTFIYVWKHCLIQVHSSRFLTFVSPVIDPLHPTQMATDSTTIVGEKNATLAQRRCIILAIVGSTPSSNISLSQILQDGFLKTVKSWLGDILSGSVGEFLFSTRFQKVWSVSYSNSTSLSHCFSGGIDLLLHMLTHITYLPVTKSVVKDSGMGKAIGSIEKHSICVGTQNEAPIKERVKELKDAWNKSVKALKESDSKQGTKREVDSSIAAIPASKKPRTEKSSFSSLLKKVNTNSSPKSAKSNAASASLKDVPMNGNDTESLKQSKHAPEYGKFVLANQSRYPHFVIAGQKKQSQRVKWSDHFGGNLSAAKIIDGENSEDAGAEGEDSTVSWSDRRRRDRLREKELLANAK